MLCHTRMKLLLQGLFWLFILELDFTVTSLEPGFLDFDNLPDTNFSCVGKVIGGYYADLETSCQMFHVCTIGQLDEPMDIRFLCLNGTVFDQETRVCERIDEVDCSKSEQFYSLNLELYGNTQPPILEESPETEEPVELLKQSTTTSTTTTPRPSQSKTPRQNFIITTTKQPLTTFKPTTISNPISSTNISPSIAAVLQASRKPQTSQTIKSAHSQSQILFTSNAQGNQPPDIRFNPEEYKINLNPGAPPDIRSNLNSANSDSPISFQTFSDNNKRVIVTTHTTVYKNQNKQPSMLSTTTLAPINEDIKSDEDYDAELTDSTEDGYSYNYHNTQPESLKTVPELPSQIPKTFYYRPSLRPTGEENYKSSTYRSVFHPGSSNPLKISYENNRGPTTYRNHYPVLKPTFHQYYHRPDKPPSRLQLPIIPTLQSLTFSSPAPFSLNRHIDQKRFINDPQTAHQAIHGRTKPMQQAAHSMHHQIHHQPPRIVISASASVSDANGRKFNYSLGTIGDTRLFGHAPSTYDDYKEGDVGLDPFYHDVPKIRLKRQVPQVVQTEAETLPVRNSGKPENLKDYDGDSEAVDVLKFLFHWYNNFEKSSTSSSIGIPIKPETITEINDELESKINPTIDYVYDDFEINLDKKGTQEYVNTHSNFEKPYLSLQLLKPPAILKSEDEIPSGPTTTSVRPPITTTDRTEYSKVETTTLPPDGNLYYDYVDDNYEPLTYEQQGSNKNANRHENTEYDEAIKVDINFKDNKKVEGEPSKLAKDLNHKASRNQDDDYYGSIINPNKDDKENYKTVNKKFNEQSKYVESSQTGRETVENLKDMPINQKEYYDYKEPNYTNKESDHKSYPDYIDDNYEAILYKEKSTTELPYTQDKYESTNNFGDVGQPSRSENRDKFKYNEKVNLQADLIVEDKPKEDATNSSDGREVLITESPLTSSNSIVTATGATQSYDQVLGILGVTTRKPKVRNRTNRGRARFSLSDISIPDDIYHEIVTGKSTKPPIVSTRSTTNSIDYTSFRTNNNTYAQIENKTRRFESPSEEQYVILGESQTTTKQAEFTINANRRTEDDFDIITTTELSTETTDKYDKYDAYTKLGETTKYFRDDSTIISTTPVVETTEYPTRTTQSFTSDTTILSTTPNYFETTDNPTRFTSSFTDDSTIVSTTPNDLDSNIPTTDNLSLNQSDHDEISHVNQSKSPFMTSGLQKLIEEVEESTKSKVDTNNFAYQTITDKFPNEFTLPVSTTISDFTSTQENTESTITQDNINEFSTISTFGEKTIQANITEKTDTFEDKTTLANITEKINTFEEKTTLANITEKIEDDFPQVTTVSIPLETTTAPYFDIQTLNTIQPDISTISESLETIITTVPTTTKPSPTKSNRWNNARRRSKNRSRFSSLPTTQFTTTTTTTSTSTTTTTTTSSPIVSTLLQSSLVYDTRYKSHRKPSINEEIIDVIKNKMSKYSGDDRESSKKIEFNINAYTANLAYRQQTTPFSVDKSSYEILTTDPPISKSANPTSSAVRETKRIFPTTPITKSTAINVNSQVKNQKYTFNCFDKPVNNFYSDPRDCRLFHYCTRGFTRTQYLDMKFVCDFGTFFDEDKLTCTKERPTRCL